LSDPSKSGQNICAMKIESVQLNTMIFWTSWMESEQPNTSVLTIYNCAFAFRVSWVSSFYTWLHRPSPIAHRQNCTCLICTCCPCFQNVHTMTRLISLSLEPSVLIKNHVSHTATSLKESRSYAVFSKPCYCVWIRHDKDTTHDTCRVVFHVVS
jgi:hypothetical protein